MKLLFNGCSFVAGEYLSWHKHFPDIDPVQHVFHRRPHPIYSPDQIDKRIRTYFDTIRPSENLAAQVSRLTGLEAIDISADGNSNWAIALSTMAYVHEHPGPYCVCIGWTETARHMVRDPLTPSWVNVNVHRLTDPKIPPSLITRIREQIIKPPEEEHVLNYASAAQMLASWLVNLGIRTVQWRSMGTVIDPEPLSYRDNFSVSLPNFDQLINNQHWISYQDSCPAWRGSSWHMTMTESDWISGRNQHPNLQAVERQAQRIADKIRQTA